MKVLVSRKAMLQAILVGGSMAGKSKTLPILNCVKITLNGVRMTISSYDGQNSITKIFDVDACDENRSFCVDCKDLTSLLRAIKDDVLDMEIDEFNIKLHHKKGVQSLPLENADEYPQPNRDKMSEGFVLNAEVFHEVLSTSRNFIQNNDLHPQMSGVFVGVESGSINFAATDGFSLFADNMVFEYSGEKKEATINLNAITPLLDMISTAEDVTISIGERYMSFRTSDAMLVSTKSEYNYPNYKAIIPKEYSISLDIDTKDILDTLSRVMLTANKESCLVKLSTDGMNVNVVSEDYNTSKKSRESLFCTREGEDIEIGLKGTYLKTCLEQIKSEKVLFHMTNKTRPVVLHDDYYPNRIIMVMPMAS